MANGPSSDFWKSVHKMKQYNVVRADGLTSASEIADHWRNHFIGIFNLNGSNTHRECYHRVIPSGVADLELFISAEDVEKAVKNSDKLKRHLDGMAFVRSILYMLLGVSLPTWLSYLCVC